MADTARAGAREQTATVELRDMTVYVFLYRTPAARLGERPKDMAYLNVVNSTEFETLECGSLRLAVAPGGRLRGPVEFADIARTTREAGDALRALYGAGCERVRLR